MREASDGYIKAVKSNTRRIGFRVSLKTDRSFFPEDILEISISRAISDGFQIGAAASDRLCLVTKATDRVEKGSRLVVSSYPGDDTGDIQPLGEFFADEVSTENSVTTIVAYDRMNRNLDKEVKWTHSTAPSFPCTQQQILDYLCGRKGITCNFTCQPFVVQTKPVGYTARELIGFIAACHAANAHFNADGELVFKQFTKTGAVIDRLRCYSYTAGNDDGFTVKGVLFDLGDDTQIYIDGDASEYDEDAEGIVEVFCPFASIEVAEYVWHNLGGLMYYSCSAEMPAENLLEVGDVYTAINAQGQQVQSIVIEQELSVSTDGFKEKISAQAVSNSNQRATANRVSSVEKTAAEGGSGAAGTLTEYTVLSDTSIKYNGVTYTFSVGESGELTGVTTDKGGAFTPTIPGTLADISAHNAAFMAVALLSKLTSAPATDIPNCIARWNTDNMIELSSAIVLRDSVGGTGDYSFGGGVIEDGGVKIACTSTSNIGSATLDLGKALSEFTFYYITRGTSGTDRGLHVMASATAQTNTLFEFGSPYANWGALINRGSWLQSGIAETEKVVLCIAYDGTTAQFYVNGNLIGSKSTSLTIPQICYLRNGMTYPSYLDNTPQYIYDLAICDAAHDAATVEQVSAMLMSKYNITGGTT